jgi:hypothetical protein
MINPASLRKRIKSYFDTHDLDQAPPTILSCAAAIEIIALATKTTPDELSRKIELSPMSVPRHIPDLRQMDLFSETP